MPLLSLHNSPLNNPWVDSIGAYLARRQKKGDEISGGVKDVKKVSLAPVVLCAFLVLFPYMVVLLCQELLLYVRKGVASKGWRCRSSLL